MPGTLKKLRLQQKLLKKNLTRISRELNKVDDTIHEKASYKKWKNHILPKGEIKVYKKVRIRSKSGTHVGYAIATLLVPASAARVSPYTLWYSSPKCRVSKATVLSIKPLKAFSKSDTGLYTSMYDSNFVYRVGNEVKPRSAFSKTKKDTCVSGIHVFLNRRHAVNY